MVDISALSFSQKTTSFWKIEFNRRFFCFLSDFWRDLVIRCKVGNSTQLSLKSRLFLDNFTDSLVKID
jgi:hypothetical protein